jgi:hypothetical protein
VVQVGHHYMKLHFADLITTYGSTNIKVSLVHHSVLHIFLQMFIGDECMAMPSLFRNCDWNLCLIYKAYVFMNHEHVQTRGCI